MLVVIGMYTCTRYHHACCIVAAHCRVVDYQFIVVFVSNGDENGMRALREEVPKLVAFITHAFV